MTHETDSEKFARMVEALRSWLPSLVIAGGWAHRLHRLHALAEPLDYLPLMTQDVDVAVDPSLRAGLANVREALLAAGFGDEMSGEDHPPVTHYHIGSAEEPFYVEFLTPLLGSENRRDGTPDSTQRVGGVSAQKLRYLELLLFDPWSVALADRNGFPLAEPATVRIPNPAAYIAQKLLIFSRRKREDQERDALYIHDTFQVFAKHLAEVRECWAANVVPRLHPSHVKRLKSETRGRFSEVSDSIRGAAQIARSLGRSVSPESIFEACRLGLERIFW